MRIIRILAIDPGETTGWSLFETDKSEVPMDKSAQEMLVDTGEIRDAVKLAKHIIHTKPDLVVYEEFKLYPWKAKSKSWSTLPTAQLIGIIKYICETESIKIIAQSPKDAKGFYDDKKLKMCGLYSDISRHQRDSVRHALYFIDFCKEDFDE